MIYMNATNNVNSVFAGYIIIHQTSVLALASLENNTMSELFGARSRLTQLALAK
jgi:MHS family metabolite:H+ symporter-like MFS transporter